MRGETLAVGSEVVVRRAKSAKDDLVYAMTVEADDDDHVVVAGPFSEPVPLDLGYVRFDPTDRFVEHFWRSRWYAVADVRDPVRGRKGWYCDVARPADVAPGSIVSADLELDLWVPAGPGPALVLDEDVFEASVLPRDRADERGVRRSGPGSDRDPGPGGRADVPAGVTP